MKNKISNTRRHRDAPGRASLGQLFQEYETSTNPVTKSVMRQIVASRLDDMERGIK